MRCGLASTASSGSDGERGIGPRVLAAFVENVVFSDPTARSCVVDPSIRNVGGIRAYEKAGFVHLRTITVPGEPAQEYVMIRRRVTGRQSPETH